MKLFNKFIALAFVIGFSYHANARVLEELKAGEVLAGKKIGFYVGSFDPIHKGHQAFTEKCLEQNLCDYILIYPAWGGDSYKQRVNIDIRHDMVFALFHDHPKIIVTRKSPIELQNCLTTALDDQYVRPKFPGTEFIGMVGSDTAFTLSRNESALSRFMTGHKIPSKYKSHTVGGLMSLPVKTFIVGIRNNDSVACLRGKIGQRNISAVVDYKGYKNVSSTKVKEAIKAGRPLNEMLSEEVIKIIKEHKVYSEA